MVIIDKAHRNNYPFPIPCGIIGHVFKVFKFIHTPQKSNQQGLNCGINLHTMIALPLLNMSHTDTHL